MVVPWMSGGFLLTTHEGAPSPDQESINLLLVLYHFVQIKKELPPMGGNARPLPPMITFQRPSLCRPRHFEPFSI